VTNTRYAVAGPDIVFENFGGDLVVLNIATGRYFGFNAQAAKVWEAMIAGAGPSDIVALGVDAAALEGFVNTLVEHAIVVPAAGGTEAVPAHVATAIAADPNAPTVDVFDDLADLIVADPIHDADEDQGWPRLARAA
jgi:hypothetical protein